MCILLILNLEEKAISTKEMIDSEAGGEFIDYKFAVWQRLPIEWLLIPIYIFNMDRLKNWRGRITYEVVVLITLPERITRTH